MYASHSGNTVYFDSYEHISLSKQSHKQLSIFSWQNECQLKSSISLVSLTPSIYISFYQTMLSSLEQTNKKKITQINA